MTRLVGEEHPVPIHTTPPCRIDSENQERWFAMTKKQPALVAKPSLLVAKAGVSYNGFRSDLKHFPRRT